MQLYGLILIWVVVGVIVLTTFYLIYMLCLFTLCRGNFFVKNLSFCKSSMVCLLCGPIGVILFHLFLYLEIKERRRRAACCEGNINQMSMDRSKTNFLDRGLVVNAYRFLIRSRVNQRLWIPKK